MIDIDAMTQRVRDYVTLEGSCTPGEISLLSEDGDDCDVWKVEVVEWDASWGVTPPDYWYVCTTGGINLYRSDKFNHVDKDAAEKLALDIDYCKSFHLGLMLRMSLRGVDTRSDA
jgi:hypothetical protein